MKKQSIGNHLKSYSILQKRKTTVNHAFASAIAPVGEYDESKLRSALLLLDQNPDGDLNCVYCGERADTWDHLVGLVKNGELRGYGHQIGNLVPCCSDCNSKKGAKGWQDYLREVVTDPLKFTRKRDLIASYLDRYAAPVNVNRAAEMLPEDWTRYCEIKQEVFRLMAEADTLASRLRGVVATEQE